MRRNNIVCKEKITTLTNVTPILSVQTYERVHRCLDTQSLASRAPKRIITFSLCSLQGYHRLQGQLGVRLRGVTSNHAPLLNAPVPFLQTILFFSSLAALDSYS